MMNKFAEIQVKLEDLDDTKLYYVPHMRSFFVGKTMKSMNFAAEDDLIIVRPMDTLIEEDDDD